MGTFIFTPSWLYIRVSQVGRDLCERAAEPFNRLMSNIEDYIGRRSTDHIRHHAVFTIDTPEQADALEVTWAQVQAPIPCRSVVAFTCVSSVAPLSRLVVPESVCVGRRRHVDQLVLPLGSDQNFCVVDWFDFR